MSDRVTPPRIVEDAIEAAHAACAPRERGVVDSKDAPGDVMRMALSLSLLVVRSVSVERLPNGEEVPGLVRRVTIDLLGTDGRALFRPVDASIRVNVGAEAAVRREDEVTRTDNAATARFLRTFWLLVRFIGWDGLLMIGVL